MGRKQELGCYTGKRGLQPVPSCNSWLCFTPAENLGCKTASPGQASSSGLHQDWSWRHPMPGNAIPLFNTPSPQQQVWVSRVCVPTASLCWENPAGMEQHPWVAVKDMSHQGTYPTRTRSDRDGLELPRGWRRQQRAGAGPALPGLRFWS